MTCPPPPPSAPKEKDLRRIDRRRARRIGDGEKSHCPRCFGFGKYQFQPLCPDHQAEHWEREGWGFVVDTANECWLAPHHFTPAIRRRAVTLAQLDHKYRADYVPARDRGRDFAAEKQRYIDGLSGRDRERDRD